MNRFLTRKVKKDAVGDGPSPSPTMSEAPGLPQPAAKKGWRRRKPVAEKKPEITPDLFLPSTDSFRTSLIMPNLSTRFSMLRDQDDPFSMMGKASDDSVLEPKRRSRLMDFGYQPSGLSDIAEISSLRAPVRPFASGRKGSFTYGEGYSTDDDTTHTGSIMSRSRPGEGNVLFGGRQKIYKIPIGDSGSVKSLGSGEPRGMRGRALYEDDVSMSAFQRFREKEKQKQLENGRSSDDSERDGDADSIAKENLNSPSLSSYNENRETISSTNSGPSILSSTTAATSVASHSMVSGSSSAFPSPNPEQAPPKSRRLYEQGLDQHVHEQQSIALTRLNSMQRKGSATCASSLAQSRSTSNLHEPGSRSPSASSRTASPLPPISTEQLTTFGSTKPRRPSGSTKTSPHCGSPGTTPLDDKDDGDLLSQSLDPVDQSKSALMGNSRPRALDAQPFQPRQMSPFQHQNLRQKRSAVHANALPVKDLGRPVVEDSLNRPGSNRTDRSWSASSSAREARNPSLDDQESTSSYHDALAPKSRDSNLAGSSRGASFTSNTSAENGEQLPSTKYRQNLPFPSRDIPSAEAPLDSLHPAMRQDFENKDSKLPFQPDTTAPQPKDSGVDFDGDSPTLGPVADSRLSGMVREHLRQRSNGSSIYPMTRGGGEDRASGFDFRIPSIYGMPNQWGLDDYRTVYSDNPPDSSNRGITANAAAIQPNGNPASGNEAADLHAENVGDWELEMRKHHLRAGSAETQAEREAFAKELAQRQRTIQENLRIKVENEVVASSPAQPSPVHSSSGLRPFALLRSKSSHESIGSKQDPLSRASTRSSNKLSIKPSKSDPSKAKSPPSPLPVGRTLHSRMPGAMDDFTKRSLEQRRTRPDPEQERYPLEIYSTPAESAVVQSASVSSDESFGFNGRHRDDIEKTVVESTGNRGNAFYDQRNARLSTAKTRAMDPARQAGIDTSRLKKQSKNPRPPKISTDDALKAMRNRKNSSPASASSDGSSHPPTSIDTPYSANSTPPLFNASSPATSYYAHAQAQANGVPSGEKAPYALPSNTGRSSASSNRKKWLQKSEISEPTLISQTSTIDTVSLPPGSNLRKSSQEASYTPASPPPPSLPPMHPLRRGFLGAFGRSNSDNVLNNGVSGKNKGVIDEYGDEELMPGQRLRIKKVSSEEGDSKRKGRLMVVPVDSPDEPSGSSMF